VKDTHPSRETLAAFDRGLLTPPDQTEVEHHVAGCTSCCETLENLGDDELVVLLKSSAVTPAASPSTIYGGNDRADTPPGKGTANPEIPAPLIDHPRYRIVGLLGAGGMGAVYQAEHRLMERAVAVKILNPELTRRPGAVQRFRQEIKAASQLSHPNIVTAYDADQADDVHFLVMELVGGKSLDWLIDPGRPLAVATACSWGRQAACGLQHAHERGMVHRDIKPANLMLAKAQGSQSLSLVKILDFGLARFASEFAASKLTASGALVGTPDYIAPEQARDPHRADIRADIYSLGCTLYHLLAGRVPHPGDTVLQKLMAHQEELPKPLGEFRRDLPPGLVTVVERMMAKDVHQRYQTPAEVIAALAPFTGEPDTSANRSAQRSRPPVALLFCLGAFLGAVGLIVAGLAYWGREPIPRLSAQTTEPATSVAIQPTVPETRMVIPENKQARDAAVAWIRNRNNIDDGNRFTDNVAAKIDKELEKCSVLLVTVGPGLLRTNKPMLLAIRQGQFHSFELLPEEVKKESERKVGTTGMAFPGDPHRLPEAVELSGLSLEQTRVAYGESLRGVVHYRVVGNVREPYSLRVSCYNSGLRHTIHRKLGPDDTTQGSCSFVIRTNEPGTEIMGPLLIYAEVGVDVQVKDGKPVGMTVVSNTLAILAHIEAATEAKPNP
jgi:serine/threonine protein kinase